MQRKNIKWSHGPALFIGSLLCLLLLPILFLNLTIIVKATLYPNEAPTILGIAPMVVVTDSMNTGAGSIAAGDMIFANTVDAKDLAVSDIILFKQGSELVLHRITSIDDSETEKTFVTKGDSNNAEDLEPVSEENIVGKYSFRISKLGHVVLFLKTSLGLILCVVIPIFLLLGYELFKKDKAYKQKTSELEELSSKTLNYEKTI